MKYLTLIQNWKNNINSNFWYFKNAISKSLLNKYLLAIFLFSGFTFFSSESSAQSITNASFEDSPADSSPIGWINGETSVSSTVNPKPDGTQYAFTWPGVDMYQNVSGVTTGAEYELTFHCGTHDPLDQTVSMQYLNSGYNTIGSPVVHNITYDVNISRDLSPQRSLWLAAAPANAVYIRINVNSGSTDYAKVDFLNLNVLLNQADLELTKTVNNTAPSIGDNITFTVTVINKGPRNATGITVKDKLPAGLTYVSSTPSIGSYNYNTGIWNFASSTLNVNNTATLTITATIEPTCGTISSTAEIISSSLPDPDSIPNNGQ